MKTALKLVAAAVGLVLIAAALVVIALVIQADTYAKGVVERTLSYVMQAELKADRIRVLPLRYSIEITGLTVANPPPFKAESAIAVQRLTLRFNPRTLFSSAPAIRQVLVQGAQVRLRYRLGEGTNLGALAKQAAIRGKAPDPAAPEAARRVFVVKEVRCEKIKLSVSANVIPLASAGLEIAPFTLENLGDKPVTPGDITALFLRSILRETLTLKGLLSPVISLLKNESADAP